MDVGDEQDEVVVEPIADPFADEADDPEEAPVHVEMPELEPVTP